MLYALYDEKGEIYQSNKVYVEGDDLANYEKVINDLGKPFVKLQFPGLIQPDLAYVDMSDKQLCERPNMDTIIVDKSVIIAGDPNGALITGIPNAASYRVIGAGVEIASGLMDATEMQIIIPVPMIYTVLFDLWPYRTRTIEIKAVING